MKYNLASLYGEKCNRWIPVGETGQFFYENCIVHPQVLNAMGEMSAQNSNALSFNSNPEGTQILLKMYWVVVSKGLKIF